MQVPVALSREEVALLIEAAGNTKYQTVLSFWPTAPDCAQASGGPEGG
ncbi:hypothetical protein [Dechloromonas sp. HYN0024]|nr:hypothetical protein [Dechloromonas sp. HYN0024]